MPTFAVIMPAAGRSSRFGGREKKPFVNLDGTAVWLRTANLFANRSEVIQSILVIAPEDREMVLRRYSANLMFLGIKLCDGGAERFDSVANALALLQPDVEYVAIHDAVRPCTPSAVIQAVFQAAMKDGAALPAVAVTDTLKRVDHQLRVVETVTRAGLWQAQTPQVFRRDWLVEAYARRAELNPVTDDAQLVEAAGHPVKVVPGSALNIKITQPEDLRIASQFLKLREADEKPRASRPFEDERFS